MMISKVRNDLENSTFEPSGLSDNLELEKHAFEMNVKLTGVVYPSHNDHNN